MKITDEFLEQLLDTLPEGIICVNTDRTIIFWSQGAETLTGFTAREMMGKKCQESPPRYADEQGINLPAGECPLLQTLSDGAGRETEVYLKHRDKSLRPVHVQAIPVKSPHGRVVGVVQVFRDNSRVASLRRQVAEMEKYSYIDPATGLGNRQFLEMHLKGKLAKLKRSGAEFGFLYLSLHGLEAVIARSPRAGEEAVKALTRILHKNTRPFDAVGRLEQNRFLAMIDNVGVRELHSIAKKLLFLVEHAIIEYAGQDLEITASIVAWVADPDRSGKAVLAAAEKKLKELEEAGGNALTWLE